MIQPETRDLLHCHQGLPHRSVHIRLFPTETFFHRHLSVYSSLLLHSCLSADLLLNPKESCQWGDKFLNGKGKKKFLFSSTKLNFPATYVCIHSLCIPVHLPTHCLCMNHQIFQVAGLLGKPWSGNQTIPTYQTSPTSC